MRALEVDNLNRRKKKVGFRKRLVGLRGYFPAKIKRAYKLMNIALEINNMMKLI